MKELLLQYANYNLWANRLIIDAIMKLDEQQIDKDIVSSFSTIRKTVYHTWSAESIWLQRLQLAEYLVWKEADFKGTFQKATEDWQRTSAEIISFVEKQYDERSFTHVLQYYDRKSNPRKTPVGEVLLHVFNHSTYHRGQLVTMLRQAGVKEIPSTDFAQFVWKS